MAKHQHQFHGLVVPYHCCSVIPSTSVDRFSESDKLVRPINAESELDHSTASSSVVAAPATVFIGCGFRHLGLVDYARLNYWLPFRNIKDKYAWITGHRKQQSQGTRTNISAETSLEGNTDGINSLV